jgi:hypothetical protein
MVNRECYILCSCGKKIVLFAPLEYTKTCECGNTVFNKYNYKPEPKPEELQGVTNEDL